MLGHDDDVAQRAWNINDKIKNITHFKTVTCGEVFGVNSITVGYAAR